MDARKAFDSVDHGYIRKCLIKFGVGNFVQVFDVLYKDLNSDIAINGGIIKGYKILRGVKQGDALSCILFIMCMEPLLRNIEMNPVIKQISSQLLDVTVPKSFAYADDVNLITKNDEASVRAIFVEYERLTKNSGLMLNAGKTEILRVKHGPTQHVEYEVNYMGERVRIKSQPEIKINGILFQQDEVKMKTANVGEVVKKMQKKLEPWSKRGLTLAGKILLTKTFGISQIIYVLQVLALEPADFKLLNSVLYKFMWNRHFKAAKAPERIKREIINLPTKLGGFGMLELTKLDRSIKLRTLGRLIMSNHPFNDLLKTGIKFEPYFFPSVTKNICGLVTQAVSFLKEERHAMLGNQAARNNVKVMGQIKETPIKNVVTANGQNSLYFLQCMRAGVTKLGQLDRNRLNQIRRVTKFQAFIPWVEESLGIAIPRVNQDADLTIWAKDKLVHLSSLSCKQIREATGNQTPVTNFKIGLSLSVAEALTWGHRINKLTSTRHKNALLKAAHGDIYTKDRKLRFGLADNDQCDRCGQPDSRVHAIATCAKAMDIWNLLRDAENKPRLTTRDPDLLKEIMGANEPVGGELAINAELVQLLTNSLDKKIATLPASIVLKITLTKLHDLERGRSKENVKTLLEKLNV